MGRGGAGQDLVSRRLSRRFQVTLVGEGALVGIVAGAIVTLYRLALSHAEGLLRLLTGEAAGGALLTLGWLVLLLLACWSSPHSQGGSPLPPAPASHRSTPRSWGASTRRGRASSPRSSSRGPCSPSRVSPSAERGPRSSSGMSGKAVSRMLGRRRGEERLLVTCGAAAGMSAAFHAPLTGVLFALEEIHKEFQRSLIISVMSSAVAADFLVSQVLGLEPVVASSFSSTCRTRTTSSSWRSACSAAFSALCNNGMFAAPGPLCSSTGPHRQP